MIEPAGTSPASFDEVADELYGLAPQDFIAARKEREKQARQAGDRELAASIHGLRKPSSAAWLANQLVREHRDDLAPLLELGAGLRAATQQLAGDQLRQLSRQQHELVYALVQQAREGARAAGQPVSPDTATGLEDTLRAALADERAAELLLAGRLTEALQHTGFGALTVGDSGGEPGSTSGRADRPPARSDREAAGDKRAAGSDRNTRAATVSARLARAEKDLAKAERALAHAASARDDAQAQLGQADEAAQKATERADELRQQLHEADAAVAAADRDRRSRTTALARTERAVQDAEHRRRDAAARRDQLAGAG